jgi:hypothetical protein
MNKEEIIKQIKDSVQEGIITKKDLVEACDSVLSKENKASVIHHPRISNILYYIGGIIVCLGIAIFIGQNWSYLNDISKVSATLGASVAAYIVGVLFSRYERLDHVSQAFYFISGLVAPVGMYVTWDLAGFEVGLPGVQSLMAGILFIAYLLSFLLFRKTIFLIFSIIFGTWLYFSVTGHLVSENINFNTSRVFGYRIIAASLTYLCLGYYLDKKGETVMETLSKWLYSIGVFVFLGTALSLGGWSPYQNIFWELIFPALAFGVIFLSINFKNRSFLLFGTGYLMLYLMKITGEYFSMGLGWPLSLILLGFVLMGVGYLTFYLNKKYISS